MHIENTMPTGQLNKGEIMNASIETKEKHTLSEDVQGEIDKLVLVNKHWSFLSLMFYALFYPGFNMAMLNSGGEATRVYFKPIVTGRFKNFLHYCKARVNGQSYLQAKDTSALQIVAVYNGTTRLRGTVRDKWHEVYRCNKPYERCNSEAKTAMGYMALVHCYADRHPVNKEADSFNTKLPKFVELFQWALGSLEQSVTIPTYGLDEKVEDVTIEWDLEKLLQCFVEKELKVKAKII